ncbi:hypothetical protein F5Y19DRAFT_462610 [Xylariaceae sp. FL1651]|nr:hypothetical protein F5Y19DRAFT_462610 [Xylariaceae sp. FL1651]
MSRDFHKCNTGELDDAAYNELVAAEIGRLRAQINEKAVCELASSLNGGKSCVVEYPSKVVGLGALTGCANYHVRIRFGDGSPSWLMRVPRVSGFAVGFPVSLAEYLIRSEYVTLKFLEITAVPAPRAFSFGIPSQGTDYGVGRLAKIYAELERYPFTKAGSLYVESPDEFPWVSATYLALIANGQLYSQFPVKAYLVYRFLQDNVSQLSDPEDKFFLKHIDDKGDHLMVDEDLDLIGIIDWQMARVVPRREAFALSLVSADMGAFYNGDVLLGTKDIALDDALRDRRPKLAKDAGDQKVRRFFWGMGLEPKWTYALPLASAILKVFGVE